MLFLTTHGPLPPQQEIKYKLPHAVLTTVSGADENQIIYFVWPKACVKAGLLDHLDHLDQHKCKPENNGQ